MNKLNPDLMQSGCFRDSILWTVRITLQWGFKIYICIFIYNCIYRNRCICTYIYIYIHHIFVYMHLYINNTCVYIYITYIFIYIWCIAHYSSIKMQKGIAPNHWYYSILLILLPMTVILLKTSYLTGGATCQVTHLPSTRCRKVSLLQENCSFPT